MAVTRSPAPDDQLSRQLGSLIHSALNFVHPPDRAVETGIPRAVHPLDRFLRTYRRRAGPEDTPAENHPLVRWDERPAATTAVGPRVNGPSRRKIAEGSVVGASPVRASSCACGRCRTGTARRTGLDLVGIGVQGRLSMFAVARTDVRTPVYTKRFG